MMKQLSLLSAQPDVPDGLRYQEEFASADVEAELITRIAALPLKPFQFGAYEGHRRVASFGWRYGDTTIPITSSRRLRQCLDGSTR